MIPISTVSQMNPVAGYDPLDLVRLLQQQIAQNSVNFQQLFLANAVAGVVDAWRIVFRALAVDVSSGQWGTPTWGVYGDRGEISSEEGTTSLQDVTRFMAMSHVNPSGAYEVQLKVHGYWYSAASILAMNPQVAVFGRAGQPILYVPGPPLNIYSFGVPAQAVAPPANVAGINPANPVGSPIPGFSNGFKNVGGPYWETDGAKDPSGEYTLRNPSPMLNNWASMVWVKQ